MTLKFYNAIKAYILIPGRNRAVIYVSSMKMSTYLYMEESPYLSEDTKMGKMNIVVDDKLEERFRKAVFQKKGMKKGNISDAIEEAIVNWIG